MLKPDKQSCPQRCVLFKPTSQRSHQSCSFSQKVVGSIPHLFSASSKTLKSKLPPWGEERPLPGGSNHQWKEFSRGMRLVK